VEFVKKVDTPKVLFDLSNFVQKHQVFDNQGRNAGLFNAKKNNQKIFRR